MLTQEQARNIIKSLKKDYGFTYTIIAEEMIGISKSHLSLFLDEKRDLKRDKIYSLEMAIKNRIGDVFMNV